MLEVILPPESNETNEASGGGSSGGTSQQWLHVPTTTSLISIDVDPSPTPSKCHKFCQTNSIPDSPPPLYKEYWMPSNWYVQC